MSRPSPTRTGTDPAVASRWRRKAAAYARLAKLDVFDYYLALPLVWTLLPAGHRLDGRVLATLVLVLLGAVAVLGAGVALDDVTGYRDGSDAANYGPDAPVRRLARKPLLTGALRLDEAVRFARYSGLAGILCWGLAIAVAPYRPLWTVAAAVGCLVMSLQYSYGLKLSYHGAQELVLIGFGVGVVVFPYGLLTGRLDGFAAVQAVLFGFGPLLFGVYSNTNDRAADAAVGRPTVAVLCSARGNAAFIAVLSAAEVAVVLAAAVAGPAPGWFPLALAPTLVLRARQLLVGLRRGDILSARRLGIRTHRTTVAALILVNLVVNLFVGTAVAT